MDEFAHLEQRIDRHAERAAAHACPAMVAELEATLSEGYPRALTAEGRMKRLDRRLEAPTETGAAAELDSVARERRPLAHRVTRLRARLAALRDDSLGVSVMLSS